MTDKLKIFYAHSNHNGINFATYDLVSNNANIIDVCFNDNKNSNYILDKIKNHIIDADIFICDITPDYEYDDKTFINSNVMLELGFAMNYFDNNNLIFICNSNNQSDIDSNDHKLMQNKIPSLLHGYEITYYTYDSNNNNYIDVIIDKINDTITNYRKNNTKWTLTNSYSLNKHLIDLIQDIFKIEISYYKIKISKKNKKIIIIFNDNINTRLNITRKIMIINDKDYQLYEYKDLYEEVKHLEIILDKEFN
jgi:hypothetical protein